MLRQDGTSDNSIICADGRRRPAKYWLRRGEQRRLLDEMRLPKSIVVSRTTAEDGTERVTKIAAASARHVLRIIDDYLRSPNGENGKPLSLELIVKRTSISKEVVLRAIRVLNDSKFIDADGYSDDHFGRCYRVIRRWKDIARKVDRWNDTGHTSPPRQDDTQDDTHPDTQDDTRTLLRATKRATNTPPPPPAPSAVTDPPHGLATDPPRDLWGEVGEALRKAGVQAWRDTLTAIRDQRGMTPDRAKALCRYFGDHHARLGKSTSCRPSGSCNPCPRRSWIRSPPVICTGSCQGSSLNNASDQSLYAQHSPGRSSARG